jgi:hypothetical protein
MVLRRDRVVAVALALVLLVAAPLAQGGFTREDADRFQAKLTRIVEYGGQLPKKAQAARSVQVTDAEVTAYLRHHATKEIPVGIVDPAIQALGEGLVGGRAVVDLDAVRKSKTRGWLDPLGYLTGRLPVTAKGRLTTKGGVGRFELQSAEISGVTVPKTVVQELLSFYSRTPEDPDGINMDDPFELPVRIREIRVARGAATVVQ